MGEGNERPRTPGRMQLMLEELGEEVTLPDENEMRQRLSSLFITPEARDKFLPLLLKHAGRTLPVSEVAGIVVSAARERAPKDEPHNMRFFVGLHIPQIIEAMVPDRRMQEKAQTFLAEALNG